MMNGLRTIRFQSDEPLEEVIDRIGEPPLPPYIKRQSGRITEQIRSAIRQSTLNQRGSIAAPTAGLHFTPSVLKAVQERGVRVVELTLHVGYGTFEPVRVENIFEHRVAAEWFSIS